MFDGFESLEGCLPLVYRGIPMHLLDTSSEPGRRLAETYFPGVDGAAFDDFGRASETVSISAIIVSDAYLAILRALRAAFEIPGPGMLIHPMLGPLTVIQGDIPQISLAANELRVIRISATFKVVSNGFGGGFIGSLLSAASSTFGSAAGNLVLSVGTAVLSVSRLKAVSRSHRILATSLNSALKTAGRGQAAAISALVSITPADASDLAQQLEKVFAALADVRSIPAVAPAAGYVAPEILSSADRLEISARLAEELMAEAQAAPAESDRAILSAAAAFALRAACEQSAYVDFASRQDAMNVRQRLVANLGTMGEALEPLSDTLLAAPATTLWHATRDLSAALSADLDEVIGRLPSALTVNTGRPTSAWLIAMHYFGDTPGLVEGAYADIVARNKPRHPAELDSETIEILK